MPSKKIIKIKPDPENPRTIEDYALEQLESSIDNFGDLSVLVCNEKTGQWVCGHQRNKVLNKKFPNHKIVKTKSIIVNGEKEWEGQVLDKNDHPTGFHVRIVNKPIEWQKMANIIANDNRIAGQYDYNKLRAVIEKYPPPPELEHFEITSLPAEIPLEIQDKSRTNYHKKDAKWTHSISINCNEEGYATLKNYLTKLKSSEDFEILY